MRKNTKAAIIVTLLLTVIFYSCRKFVDQQVTSEQVSARMHTPIANRVDAYRFERINEHNFLSQGWREQQGNVVNGVTVFSDTSENVEIVCGPDNNHDHRLNRGCITMNLPTGADPTLRRIRLRRAGYSGTLLADLTELKYSTYVVQNAPTNMVLQIDVNGDELKDFNIFYEPRAAFQPPGFPAFVLNTWQQWDALNQGEWHPEISQIPIPQHLQNGCTIQELIAVFPNARIIDTPVSGNNGEGVRFTIGGTPRSLFDNTIGYFDAMIIGTKNEQHATLFDFMCDQSGN